MGGVGALAIAQGHARSPQRNDCHFEIDLDSSHNRKAEMSYDEH